MFPTAFEGVGNALIGALPPPPTELLTIESISIAALIYEGFGPDMTN